MASAFTPASATTQASASTQAPASALADGLARTLGGRITRLRRLSGGASQETWALALQCADSAAVDLILRRQPPGGQQRSAANAGLAAEAALITLAGRHGVPVPAIHQVLTPADALGQGFVMQCLQGETLGRRIATDPALAEARATLAWQCGQTLARLHAIAPQQLPAGLRRAGPADELAHYRAWHQGHGTARPVFQLAFDWLARRLPADTAAPVLVHGDFRNGNLMIDAQGLRGVLDWELAHVGDPMEDLGWLCVPSWRFGQVALPVGGFGTLDQLLAGYQSAGGRADRERIRWWTVMGALKWGVICESMLQAWLSGAEREVEKAAIGRRASEAEIDLLTLIVPEANPHHAPGAQHHA
ncbi:phosphotransferase family protein [Aquabacterium sp. OR-4]|uniref:phosphotransferase family protein n=1 Tax=Aquabacterium sp. OR-4 TaxID=2978127 RepID=UPI0021B2BA46|nr:phosphotransferase family protein [Aquabacterium sp. OR-4]MDT7837257.1 phosphotransferase family protein [Aquabacterium sp. OR-4]